VLVADGTSVFVAVGGMDVFVAVGGIAVEVKVGTGVAVDTEGWVGSVVAVATSMVGSFVAVGSDVSAVGTISVGTGVQSTQTAAVGVGSTIISPPSEKRIVQAVMANKITIHNIFLIMLPPELNVIIQKIRCIFHAKIPAFYYDIEFSA